MSKDDDDDEVGYKKPPVKSRFRKGQSGNPRGRPKKDPTVRDAIRKLLRGKIYVTLEGVRKRIPRRDAIAHRVVNGALSGEKDPIKIAMATDDAAGTGKGSPEDFALSPDDEAILAAFTEEAKKKRGTKRKKKKKPGGKTDG
jgi:hypothetical protein